jgi:hypothetical protein
VSHEDRLLLEMTPVARCPSLEEQILAAFRRALAEGRADAAEHLLRALEVLCSDAESDSPLGEAYLTVIAPPGDRRRRYAGRTVKVSRFRPGT